jgi:hypothetical protein
MLVAHLLGQLAPSAAVQFVLVDGKGGPDYDRLFSRAWLSAKDDLGQVRDVLRQVHRLMVDRQGTIARVLGETDAWHVGPSSNLSCPRDVATHQRFLCHSLAFPRTASGVRPLVQRPVWARSVL